MSQDSATNQNQSQNGEGVPNIEPPSTPAGVITGAPTACTIIHITLPSDLLSTTSMLGTPSPFWDCTIKKTAAKSGSSEKVYIVCKQDTFDGGRGNAKQVVHVVICLIYNNYTHKTDYNMDNLFCIASSPIDDKNPIFQPQTWTEEVITDNTKASCSLNCGGPSLEKFFSINELTHRHGTVETLGFRVELHSISSSVFMARIRLLEMAQVFRNYDWDLDAGRITDREEDIQKFGWQSDSEIWVKLRAGSACLKGLVLERWKVTVHRTDPITLRAQDINGEPLSVQPSTDCI
ncbi:hypothetical protein Pelo_18066 [Pelomyxa schiedti]|nr:hypothetical protein Pelo_18066 [Pelomyxa schiedti]